MMPPPASWRVWQLIDSAFPAGALAHSGGIEAAYQWGGLRSAADVEQFAGESIEQVAHLALPFVRAAMLQGCSVAALDARLDSFLSSHVANRASRLQGRALVASASDIFPQDALVALRRSVIEGRSPGHLAVMFGAVLGALNMDSAIAQRMYLFITMRGVLSAAVRLAIVGPLEAQRIQAALDCRLDDALAGAATLNLDDVCQTSPLLELWQMGQDRLYSRLFQS